MSDKTDHIITGEDRTLAQVALATVGDTPGVCPDVADLALLVDGRCESESQQEELWNHLAGCPTCYEQWRIIAEVQAGTVKKRSFTKIISIGSGLLAAAASIMVFVNIQQEPMVDITSMQAPSVMDEAVVAAVAPVEVCPQEESPAPLEMAETDHEVERKMQRSQSQRRSKSASPPRLKKEAASAGEIAGGYNAGDPFGDLFQEDVIGEMMLDINRLIPTVLQRIKQAGIGDVIEVKTYKRDRGFSVEKRSEEEVLIREFGFKDQEITVPIAKLKKTLKSIVKTEFPRSNKVWLRTGVNDNE